MRAPPFVKPFLAPEELCVTSSFYPVCSFSVKPEAQLGVLAVFFSVPFLEGFRPFSFQWFRPLSLF